MRESASNNLILNCDSYNNADYVAGSSTYDGGNADGFAPKLDLGTGNVFRGCRAWGAPVLGTAGGAQRRG